MYKNILLATDGSETSQLAEDYALQIYGNNDTKLTILHVIDEKLCHYGKVDTLAPLEARESFIEYVITELEEAAQDIDKMISEKAEKYGAKYTFKLKQGEPIDIISSTANEEDVDLVIIGGKRSKRNGGFKSVTFTDKLSGQTEKMILTVI